MEILILSEKVKIETLSTVSSFMSSGGYETAVRDFLKKFPNNSTGTVTIRKDTRVWFKSGDKLIIGKGAKETGMLSYGYATCPSCEAIVDKTDSKVICVSCGTIVKVTKKGEQYFTEIFEDDK